MLFVIHGLDKPDALPTRLANYDAHKTFLSDTAAHGVDIVMSGPLVTADDTMIGSLFLVEAKDRETVVRFNQADPFARAGVWGSLSINGFVRRQGQNMTGSS